MRAEIFYGVQDADKLMHGTRDVDNPDDVRTVFQSMIARFGWQRTPQHRIDLSIAWIQIRTDADSKPSDTTEGIGDITLSTTLWPWAAGGPDESWGTSGLSFTLGLKMPTGRESDSIDPTNPTPPSLLQTGTGTWDPIFGLGYATHLGPWHLYLNAFTQITGGASDIGFRPGSVLVTRAGTGYDVASELNLSLTIEGEFREPDEVAGRDLGFTGSSIWSVTPAAVVTLGGFDLTLSARIPFFWNVRGTQLVPELFVSLGVAFVF